MLSPASRTSSNSFFVATVIKKSASVENSLSKVWVANRALSHQIDWPPKQFFQCLSESEIIIRILARWLFFERYKEIQITVVRIKTLIGCGSKQIKPLHPKPPADSNNEFIGSSTQQIHILVYWLVPFCRCFDKNAKLSCVNQSRCCGFIGRSMS